MQKSVKPPVDEPSFGFFRPISFSKVIPEDPVHLDEAQTDQEIENIGHDGGIIRSVLQKTSCRVPLNSLRAGISFKVSKRIIKAIQDLNIRFFLNG